MKIILGLIFALTASAQLVWFEPNRGQVAGQTQWIGRSRGAYLYITGDEVVYANSKNVHMRLVGGSRRAHVEGVEPTGGISSYFTGRDEKTWFTGIPHYAKLRYRDVYPGIDMVYYGSRRNVEYDFVVKLGADPGRIELAFSEPVKIEGGDLVVAGLRQHRPKVMQDGQEIGAEYRITEDNHVQIGLGDYDKSRQLTVDPVLEFATYLGGPGNDSIATITFDRDGYLYVAGATQSPATPGLNPFQQSNITILAPFVLKLAPTADRVVYFAVIDSHEYSGGRDLALDSTGAVVVTGFTYSSTFPLKNAAQTEFRAGFYTGFVTKLSADARSLVYSTYLGGSGLSDSLNAVRTDSEGNAYVFGETYSHDIPLKNPIQPVYAGGEGDCILTKYSPQGAVTFATYLGSSARDVCKALAVAPDGGILLTGAASASDFPLKDPVQTFISPKGGTPFLAKITPDGQKLLFSTFYGGPVSAYPRALALDGSGNIYMAGDGDSSLTTKNAFQPRSTSSDSGFLAKFDSTAHNLVYATYLGGSGLSIIYGLAVDSSGSPMVTGYAGSNDFPVKNSLQPFRGGGIANSDCFVAKFSPSGNSLIYSTLFGGTGPDGCQTAAVDSKGNVWVAGATSSADLPVKNPYQREYGGSSDGFIAEISDNTPVVVSPLTPSTGLLSFQYVQNGANPPPQSVGVTGPGFLASTDKPWLSVVAAPSGIAVSVNPAGFAPGIYRGSVTLTTSDGPPATIDVSVNVLAPAPMLTSIEPALIPVNSDDTVLTIHGSGFTTGTTLQVNTLPWTSTPVVFINTNTIQLTFTKPTLIFETTWAITVQNPQSALSNVLPLAVGKAASSFTAASVTNAASYVAGPVAPGEIVTIFGANLDANVTFDLIPVTPIYSSPEQVSVTVPYIIAGPTTTLRIGLVPVTLDVAAAAPGIFAAVTDPANNIITLYATGCGLLSPDPLPRCILPVSVTINGHDAPVLYAGIAPGLAEGANQINIQVPPGVSAPLKIVLKAGEAFSKEITRQ